MPFTLKCFGCEATTTVERIGQSKDGFVYESFNGGFYFCPKKCDANVDVFDTTGNELLESVEGHRLNDMNLTEHACPECGENHTDHLLIDDETEWPNTLVKCQTCGHKYKIGGAE